MWSHIKTLPQYCLPQHLLSRCMYRLARWRWSPWKNFVIGFFIRTYQVNMHIAEQSDPHSYASFNEFFTRTLKAGERPVDTTPLAVVSPVDGSISQLGEIDNNVILQAKGRHFNLQTLLADDAAAAERLGGGSFATIYLSPRDYHRVHMPVDGNLVKMTYVPGDLFSVNTTTSLVVNQLYARNERVICLFETQFGLLAMILVGAIFVGTMETIWQGEIRPGGQKQPRVWDYQSAADEQKFLHKGSEMGRFNMGSTVIILFESDRLSWNTALHAGSSLQMGERIGTAAEPADP